MVIIDTIIPRVVEIIESVDLEDSITNEDYYSLFVFISLIPELYKEKIVAQNMASMHYDEKINIIFSALLNKLKPYIVAVYPEFNELFYKYCGDTEETLRVFLNEVIENAAISDSPISVQAMQQFLNTYDDDDTTIVEARSRAQSITIDRIRSQSMIPMSPKKSGSNSRSKLMHSIKEEVYEDPCLTVETDDIPKIPLPKGELSPGSSSTTPIKSMSVPTSAHHQLIVNTMIKKDLMTRLKTEDNPLRMSLKNFEENNTHLTIDGIISHKFFKTIDKV